MSAERFINYRDRVSEIWVDAQTCVFALEYRIRRTARNASILKWGIFGTGILTGAAGLEFLSAIVGIEEEGGKVLISSLAFLTAVLTGMVPLLAFDEKLKRHTDTKHKFNDIQGKLVDYVYVRMEKPLDDSDGLEIARMSDQVEELRRVDHFNEAQYFEQAVQLKDAKAFSRVVWHGPEDEPAGPAIAQGQADDLRPITRG